MIYKVLYQSSLHSAPIRENTKSLYIEAESESDVRLKLQEKNYNIEYIQVLEGAHLEYEKRSEDFELASIPS